MEALFFWIFAVGLVSAGLAVILNRNPVSSALSLVVGFVFLAALFVTLEAFFLAMVQIIVYAGAVMVLFLFIIMLLDIKAEEKRPFPWIKCLVVAGVLSVIGVFFGRVLRVLPSKDAILVWGVPGGVVSAKDVGTALFTQYVLAFEVTSVLLLVATVGVVLLSRRDTHK